MKISATTVQRATKRSHQPGEIPAFLFPAQGREGGGAKHATCIGQSLHGDGWSPVTDSHLRDAESHVTAGHIDRLDSRLAILPNSR